MDYWSRIIIFSFTFGGAGIYISRWFGEPVLLAVLGVAIGIATDSALRTIRNVGGPRSVDPLINQTKPAGQSDDPGDLPPAPEQHF